MALKLTNNATSTLAANIDAVATIIPITSGDEVHWPVLAVDGTDWHPVTIVDANGNIEICKCTMRSGVNLTVARGQEGTTARPYSLGARVEVRLTSAALTALLALPNASPLTLSGPLATDQRIRLNGPVGIGPTGIEFGGLDLSFGVRAGPPIKWVWNDKADFTGTDVMELTELGVLKFGIPLKPPMVGPTAAVVDNAVARYDEVTGQILQDSKVLIDDTGSITLPTGANINLATGQYIGIGGTVGWVGQNNMKVATQQAATTATYSVTAFAGGTFCFEPTIRSNANVVHFGANASAVNALGNIRTTDFSSSYGIAYYSFGVQVAGASTMWAEDKYLIASPPYDLGDGEIADFIWMLIEKGSGNILGTSVAPDPPWANNGPTSIRPEITRGGRNFRKMRRHAGKLIHGGHDMRAAIAELVSAGVTRHDAVDRLLALPLAEVEIDQEMKQRDMPLIPHPWIADPNFLDGTAVPVLLDPVSEITQQLARLHAEGVLIDELLHKDGQTGDIRIGNSQLKRAGPPGVMVVSLNWR